MTIQVFPEPAAGGSSAPIGAGEKVVEGWAKDGGFNYNTTLTSGNYLLNSVGAEPGTQMVQIESEYEPDAKIINNGTYAFNLTTQENRLSVSVVNKLDYVYTVTHVNTGNRPEGQQSGAYLKDVGVVYLMPSTAGHSILFSSDNFVTVTRTTLSPAQRESLNGGLAQKDNQLYIVARTSGYKTYTSTDGVNWTDLGNASGWTGQIYTPRWWKDRWYTSNTAGTVYSSTNFTNWSLVTVLSVPTGAYNPDGIEVCTGGITVWGRSTTSPEQLAVSTDGSTWGFVNVGGSGVTNRFGADSDGRMIAIMHAEGAAGSNRSFIMATTNMTTWVRREYYIPTNTKSSTFQNLQYAGGVWFSLNVQPESDWGSYYKMFYTVNPLEFISSTEDNTLVISNNENITVANPVFTGKNFNWFKIVAATFGEIYSTKGPVYYQLYKGNNETLG